MKKLLVTVAMLFITTFSLFADSMTEMEEWQAKKVASYLQSQLYIMQYCDCCTNESLDLIRIEYISIEPADRDLFQIRVIGKHIASFATNEMGRLSNGQASYTYFNDLISVNYTFTAINDKAVSIGTALEINNLEGYDISSCQQFINLPLPTLHIFAGNSDYKNWYKQQAKKVDYNALLVGTWRFSSMKDERGEDFSEADSSSIRFNADHSFVMLRNKDIGTWAIEDNELVITEGVNRIEKMNFYLAGDLLQLKIEHKSTSNTLLVLTLKR